MSRGDSSSRSSAAANESKSGPYYFGSLHDDTGRRKYPRFAVYAFDGSIVRTFAGSFAGADARNEAGRLNRLALKALGE